VAHGAGVSLKTASRVINGEQYVAKDTRDRVLKSARDLGYVINPMASSLARGMTSNTISLITGDLANPFYAAIATGVEREIRGHDFRLTLASSGEDPDSEIQLLEEFALLRTRAVLLVSTLDQHDRLESIQRRGVPILFIDRLPVGLEADAFVLDNYDGTRAAIEQLTGLGHRRIAYVGDFARIWPHKERYRAFTDAMMAAGLAWERYAVRGVHSADSAESLTRELLTLDPPPTAVFTANNRATVGALRAIKALAPETAIIGFDDFELADVLGITTVSNDPVELGRLAAKRALASTPVDLTAGEGSLTVLPTAIRRRGSGERPPAA
jgi:LacI family transcriptional regulator